MLKISVCDTGVGIPESNLPYLFNIFGKLKDSEQMNKQGCGLGLFISKLIVQKLGGDILVKSVHGAGSKFSFFIKCLPADEIRRARHVHLNFDQVSKEQEPFDVSNLRKALPMEYNPFHTF